MNRFALALALAGAVSLSGCVVIDGEHSWGHDEDWRKQQRENREVIAALDIGTPRAEVTRRLGAPDFSEAYTRDGEEYRVLFFRTQHRRSDGDTSKDETTPLVFRNDILIGWGDEVYASVR